MIQPRRRDLLAGLSHPLFWGALALLLLNDHVLKAAHPGPWLTGKLSDVAWLVVAPVVLGAGLAALRLPGRLAAGVALAVPVVAFVALQLWAPLGEAWVGLFGGAHVADVADLVALPGVGLVPLCWRGGAGSRWLRRAGAVVGLGALVATTLEERTDTRLPCDGTVDWDPAQPLVLDWSHATPPDEPELLAAGIALEDAAGNAVDLRIVRTVHGTVLVCPDRALEPSSLYTWTVGGWKDLGRHVVTVPFFDQSGRWSFTTAASSSFTGACTEDPAWLELSSCGEDSGQ